MPNVQCLDLSFALSLRTVNGTYELVSIHILTKLISSLKNVKLNLSGIAIYFFSPLLLRFRGISSVCWQFSGSRQTGTVKKDDVQQKVKPQTSVSRTNSLQMEPCSPTIPKAASKHCFGPSVLDWCNHSMFYRSFIHLFTLFIVFFLYICI